MKMPTIDYFRHIPRLVFKCALCFCLLIILTITSNAQNNRWQYVGTDTRGFDIYLDKTSVTKSDNGFFTWDKIISSDGSYNITRSDWQCRKKQHRIITSKIYTAQGSFIKTVTGGNVWLDITPDSVAESLYKVVCRADSAEGTVPDKTSVRVSSKMANIRESPSVGGAVIGTAARGKIFRLVNAESQNGWYRIYFAKNEIAWIHKSTVK